MNISFRIIGQNIKKARKAANLTQEKAAEKVNLSTLHYGRIERGERRVSLDQLAKISTVLDIPFEALLDGCIIDRENYAAAFETVDNHTIGYAEYALILLDEYCEQLKAYYQKLKNEDAPR